MIREERDWTFWQMIADHPDVKDHVFLGKELRLDRVVTHPSVKPLASKSGGFLFCRLDGIGRVFELHTIYAPAGWGREVAKASKIAFDRVFREGAQIITTYEVEDWWRSRPPLSHGWKKAGDFEFSESLAAEVRSWVLTRDAWMQSPVGRRACQLQQLQEP